MKHALCASALAGVALAASISATGSAQELLGAPSNSSSSANGWGSSNSGYGATSAPRLRGDSGPSWYGELGGGYVMEEFIDTIGIMARVGVETQAPDMLSPVVDVIAYESDLMLGVLKDDDEPDLDYAFGGAARFVKGVTPQLDIFAKAGIQRIEIENTDDWDLLLGVGGEVALSQRTGVRTDVNFVDELEILTLTFTQDF